MSNADVRRSLYTWNKRGVVVQTACKYIINAGKGDNLDSFCRRAAQEAKALGAAPFEVVEKPQGTPAYAILYILSDMSDATIPPEFWKA